MITKFRFIQIQIQIRFIFVPQTKIDEATLALSGRFEKAVTVKGKSNTISSRQSAQRSPWPMSCAQTKGERSGSLDSVSR